MDINKLLDDVRQKLELDSDYKLSKATGISEQDLSKYRRGLKVPDAYACFRIAEILEDSPSKMIARIQADTAKNEDKRLFFKSFLTSVGLWIILAVIPVSYIGFSDSAHAGGNSLETRADSTYTAIMRSRKWLFKARSWLVNLAENCRYFTCNWSRKIRFAD